MKLELEAAHQENEVLAYTIADQRMSPSSSKLLQLQSVVEAETTQHSPQTDIDLQSKLQSVLADLALEKEHTCQMETTADIREKTIYELQTQLTLAQETNAQDVENVQRLESVCEELAKETLRTAELTSVLQAQEEIIASLQKELDDERDQRTRDKTTQNERIGELEVAYSDQVAKNHEQYMELEEAMDEREAKFSERIRELETESDQQQRDIAHLQEIARKLKSAESKVATLQQGLARTQAVLEERVRQVSQITEKIELQERQLRQQDDAMAALKRQAADDVFRSTKQERRIEKLLHDREMLNIAVEQLQIHIQLVSQPWRIPALILVLISTTRSTGETPVQGENRDPLGRGNGLSIHRQGPGEHCWRTRRPQRHDSAGRLQIHQLLCGTLHESQQAMRRIV